MTIDDAEDRALGKRVQFYRRLRGFATAGALAEAIPDGFVTKATIINIEAGRKKDPSIRDMLGISYGLGVPVAVLLVDLDRPFEPVGPMFPGTWSDLPSVEAVDLLGVGHLSIEDEARTSKFDPGYRLRLVSKVTLALRMAAVSNSDALALRADPDWNLDAENSEATALALERRGKAEMELAQTLYETCIASEIEMPPFANLVADITLDVERRRGTPT